MKKFNSSLVKKDLTVENDTKAIQIENNENKEYGIIVNKVLKDIEKCENSMGEIFGPVDSPLNLSEFTEYEIKEMFKKFNLIKFNSNNMSDLMTFVSSSDFDLRNDMSEELSNIKPCRMFQKITFLDEIRKILTNSHNIEFKNEILNELNFYFEQEVKNSSSIANLTMVLNVMESFGSEKKINQNEKFSKDLDSLIDQIEEDYEEVLLIAEKGIENTDSSESESEISKKIILQEIELNNKYKVKILDLLKGSF